MPQLFRRVSSLRSSSSRRVVGTHRTTTMLKNVFSRMSFAGSESFFSKLDSKLGQLHEQLETLEVRTCRCSMSAGPRRARERGEHGRTRATESQRSGRSRRAIHPFNRSHTRTTDTQAATGGDPCRVPDEVPADRRQRLRRRARLRGLRRTTAVRRLSVRPGQGRSNLSGCLGAGRRHVHI